MTSRCAVRAAGPGAAREVDGIRLRALRPQGVDGALELVGRAGVVEDDVGDGAALRVGGLGGDAVPGVVLGEASLLDEPAHPGLDVGLDDDGEVLVHPEAALDEEGHVVDGDTVTRSGGPLRTCDPGRDRGPGDGVEGVEGVAVGEDDGGQGRPVERAVVADHAVAEALPDPLQASARPARRPRAPRHRHRRRARRARPVDARPWTCPNRFLR